MTHTSVWVFKTGADMEKSSGVKSIIKAFAILEQLNDAEELSISELSAALEMDKTTVHRIVNTIKDTGFVSQNPITKKYSNTMKFYAYGKNVLKKNELGDIARPYIRQIAQLTGETANLGIRVDNQVIYIDRAQSESGVQVATTTGRSIPMYCTGMGKAIMAYLSEDEINSMLSSTELIAYTHNTAVTKEDVLKQLEEVRKRKIAIDHEEFEVGLIAFGAPIFNSDGEPIAAISISCPSLRYDRKKQGAFFEKLLSDAATIISMKLGYTNNPLQK